MSKAEEVEGNGGFKKVVLQRESGASCEVYVYAAHITSWKTDEGTERLYLSSATEFAEGKAFRGGVPICWPQFAARGKYMKHGFARNTNAWKVRRTVAKPDPSVTLELRDCKESESWPFSFVLTYTVTLEANGGLNMAMHVVNNSDETLAWTGALHQYFAVSDVANVRVSGLQGLTFEDNTKGGTASEQQEELVSIVGETDRLYFDAPDEMIMYDGDSCVSVQKTGFPDAVVWNIGEEKAAGMKDLGAGEWQRYVCVEAVVAQKPIEIAAGESWSGSQRFVAGAASRIAAAEVGTADAAMSEARQQEIQAAFQGAALPLDEAYQAMFNAEERGEYSYNDFCGDIDGFASKMASKDKLTFAEAKLFLETVG